ncbi:DUF5686 family protein [Flavobacterium sp. '19STA2R22 D10 B1']|uniref:DUF5686 family protein n=1 Tax=Flavobacterium aerium TaxID=3037261 RepID=UPI00278C793E|nr:DUF5686 family protein [Flavobacterium sp. '19STA2R22 D10 B1']
MRLFTILLLLSSFISFSQGQISGIVKNNDTDKALPFANVVGDNGTSTITDITGKFILDYNTSLTKITISYVGYKNQTIAVEHTKSHFIIKMTANTEELNAVTVGENPAITIIRNVIQNKRNNNPEKKLKSFEFKSYNKLVVTANPDSINGSLDSIYVEKNNHKNFVKIDSTDYKFKKIIDKQHLYQTEKVSLFQFNNQGFKETVLATKMAGFKQPIYELIAVKLQSFSIYNNSYELLETDYDSPIADYALNTYRYKLLDTVNIDGRKTYMIYFQHQKKSKKAALQGVVYIDVENSAVAKAIIRTKGVLDVSATHEYEYVENEKVWFPTKKIFKIAKGNNDDDIKIFGGNIKFEASDEESDDVTSKKVTSDFVYLLSESTYFETKFNIPLKIKKAAIAIEIKDDAINKPDDYWNTYRKDSLDARSVRTYVALDSLVAKEGIEQKLKFGRKLINGYVPIGFIDLDLRYLFRYNNYEGFRVGLGGITNDRFSQRFRIEGYTVYGTKDDAFKYSFGGAVRLGKFSNSWVGGSYTDDVREIASTTFAIDKRVFRLYDPRPINVSTFYNHRTWNAFIETKILPKTESIWQLTHSVVEPKFDYLYYVNNKLFEKYTMTTAVVSIQWNPFSDFMQTPNGRIETEKRFPKFTFQYTQSLPKVIDNDFEFSKFDLRMEYEQKYLNGQKTALLFEGGYALGDVPLTHLYNTSPNNLDRSGILKRITIAGKNSFETMYFNEFFSSKYAFFQLKHGFKRVTITKKIRPSLVLVTRAGWGNLAKQEQHVGIDYKTMNNGYYESGVELNQIFKGFGLSGFFRYGPYELAHFDQNLSIKLTYIFTLGL